MITRHKVAIVGILTSASIAIGAVSGMWSASGASASAQPNPTRAANTIRPIRNAMNGKTDIPNLTAPFVSEDRYVNGAWIGNVTPSNLPHASGECDPCN